MRLLDVLEDYTGGKTTLRYARAALTFRELEKAEESLTGFSPLEPQELNEYHSLGAVWSELTANGDALRQHLAELARIRRMGEAHDPEPLLKLAGLIALSGESSMPDDLWEMFETPGAVRWSRIDGRDGDGMGVVGSCEE